MGCPGATIVFEELVQLGCKKLIRVGTCGGLQASRARRPDRRALGGPGRLDGDAPRQQRAALPDRVVEPRPRAVHIAKHSDQKLHIGPIVSSDLFYNPNEGQYERWSSRGVLAVEMEAAALFTVAAIRGVESGCFLIVSDIVVEGVFTRISDEEMKASVDRMTKLALDVAVAFRRPQALTVDAVFLVNHRRARTVRPRSAGRRAPARPRARTRNGEGAPLGGAGAPDQAGAQP